MIFVNLIYGHFDILMSQYAQMNKSHAIQGYAKVVFWLHTAKTENPDPPKHIQAPLVARNTTQIHPNTPQIPPRHPPAISSEHKKPTDDNRHQQTPSDQLKRHQSVSEGVWGCLLASVVV